MVIAVVAFLLVAVLWAFQRRLIYLPGPRVALPAAALLRGSEEVSFETADGLRLAGWFLPARTAVERPGGRVVLVLNGNAGDRSARAPLAAALAETGFSVLLFDYRGYGGNPGHPTEAGLATDARAARSYLLSRSDVDPGSLVYFGESLGAAVAVELAADHPPAALVLRSPFTSLADVGRVHYPYLPVRWLLWDRYDSLGRIAAVRCPLLVLAGRDDGIIPPEQSRRLYGAAHPPKRYAEISGADHNDWELLAGDRLLHEVTTFLRRA